jgi:hypothetical protein
MAAVGRVCEDPSTSVYPLMPLLRAYIRHVTEPTSSRGRCLVLRVHGVLCRSTSSVKVTLSSLPSATSVLRRVQV